MKNSKDKKTFDRLDMDIKFKELLKRANKDIDGLDERIEEEIAKARQFHKNGRISEEESCKAKVGRLLKTKLRKQNFADKIETTRDRLDEMLDNLEFNRAIGEVYSGFGTVIDKKEMKSMLADVEKFNKQMKIAETNVDIMMSALTDSMDKTDNTTEVDAIFKAQYDQMMDSYEKRIEETEDSLDSEVFTLH